MISEIILLALLVLFICLSIFLRKRSENNDLRYIYGRFLYFYLPANIALKLLSADEEMFLSELSSPYNFEKEKEKYICEKLGVIILLIFLGVFLSVLFGADYVGAQKISNVLSRPTYLEGERNEKLRYKINCEGGDESGFLELKLKESMTDEEVVELLEARYEELLEKMLGENKTSLLVSENLLLDRRPFEDEILVKYHSSDENILSDRGEIVYENTEVGKEYPVFFEITLECRGVVLPVSLEFIVKRNAISIDEEKSRLVERVDDNGLEIFLPETMLENEGDITWYKTSTGIAWYQIFVSFLLVSVGVYFLYKRVLELKVEKYRHSILLDLPDMINKLTLLIKAGFTPKKAWLILCDDYEKSKTFNRPLFDEMLVARNDILKGIAFEEMLLNFGKSCGNHQIMTMVSMLSQNMKRGSVMLIMSLEQMGKEAWDMRIYHAKMVGEKASIKLLIPLGISFLVVILVIMAPLMIGMSI